MVSNRLTSDSVYRSGGPVRVRFAIRAGMLSAVFVGVTLPAGAQPPPRPASPPLTGQPRDPGRPPTPEPVGTGLIRGQVVTGDTGNPVRRASVNLIPSPPLPPSSPPGTPRPVTTMNGAPAQIAGAIVARPKTVTTDAQGGFEFANLPAGSYRLLASAGQYSAAYLGIAYGGKTSGPGYDMGTPIQLTDGQTFAKAVIALPRGAVITGRVTDETGEALARVQVYTVLFQQGSTRGQRTGSGGQTDDLGQFRLYGLPPGDYAVVAEARGNTFVPPSAPPETEEDKIGFMTTYFPGTADEGAAQRVRTRAGTETPGVEIRMVSGRLFRITGAVMDSQGRPAGRTSGTLSRRMPGLGSMGSTTFGFSTDEQGRFQMRNIPPGSYRLSVRQRPAQVNANGMSTDSGEMASVPLTVASDLDDVAILTTTGATITGQVVFEQDPPGPMSQPIRVSASFGSPEDMMGMATPPAAIVAPDLTFTIKGMLGEFVLRAGAPNQHLKAIMLTGEDITDTPREFTNGDRVKVILTSRASTLEGNVTDARGQPVTDASLLLFGEDKGSWRSNSFKTRRSGTDPNGHYKISGLMPGRYFVAAVARERMNVQSPGTEFFEQLSKEATSLVIGEDDQRQVDLKVLLAGGAG